MAYLVDSVHYEFKLCSAGFEVDGISEFDIQFESKLL